MPSILDAAKDFAASERLRSQNQGINGRVQGHQGTNVGRVVNIPDHVSEKLSLMELNLDTVRSNNGVPKSLGALQFDDKSSSSDCDSECHGSFLGIDPGCRQIGLDNNAAGMTQITDTVDFKPWRDSNCRSNDISHSPLWATASVNRDVSVGSRFSFVPGDDSTFPANECSEIHPNVSRGSKITDAAAYSMDSLQNRHSMGQLRNHRSVTQSEILAVENGSWVPFDAQMSHEALTAIKPNLRSNNSTGSIDTVINLADESHRNLPAHGSASSKVTVISHGSPGADQRHRKSTECPFELETIHAPMQPRQSKTGAQLAVCHALHMRRPGESVSEC